MSIQQEIARIQQQYGRAILATAAETMRAAMQDAGIHPTGMSDLTERLALTYVPSSGPTINTDRRILRIIVRPLFHSDN